MLSSISLGSAHCWTLIFFHDALNFLFSLDPEPYQLKHIPLIFSSCTSSPQPNLLLSPKSLGLADFFFPDVVCFLSSLDPEPHQPTQGLITCQLFSPPAPPRHNPMLLQKSVSSPLLDCGFSLCCFLSSLDPERYQPVFRVSYFLLYLLAITQYFARLQKSVFSSLLNADFSLWCLLPPLSRPRTISANISPNHVPIIFSSCASSS